MRIKVTKYRRPSGSWYTSYIPATGALPVRATTGTENEVEAERLRHRLERELNREAFFAGEERYDEVAAIYVDRQERANTRRGWASQMRRWHPIIGDLLLCEIGDEHIEQFIRQRRKQKVSDTTIKAGLNFLSALFTDQGWPWHKNPVKLFSKKHLKKSRVILRTCDPDEQARLMALAREPVQAHLIEFAIETGLRRGELLELKTSCVHLRNRQIVLSPQDTKGNRGRSVPLTARAIEVLHLAGYDPEKKYVFYHARANGALEPVTRIDPWYFRLRARAGCPDLRWHDLRHTFASRYLSDGGSLAALQKVLGHSSIKLTMIYAHLEYARLDLELDILDRVRGERARQRAAKAGAEAVCIEEVSRSHTVAVSTAA